MEKIPDDTLADSETQPTVASEEVLPSGGSSAALQLEDKKSLNLKKETPVSQEREETIESDGSELKEEEQETEMDEGDNIYW